MTHRLASGESRLFPIHVWSEDGDKKEYVPASASHDVTVASSNPQQLPASVVQKGEEKFVKVTNAHSGDATGMGVTVTHGAHSHVMQFDLGDPKPGSLTTGHAESEEAPEKNPDEPAKDYPAPQV